MPYIAYLVYGYVYDSLGNIVPNATLKVTTSVGVKEYTTDSDGIFMYDLAEVGYTSGETVAVAVTEPYNNETKAHTFIVEGFWKNENITLILRTVAGVNTVGYITTPIIHSVGHKPITSDNPLPVTQNNTLIFEERRSYNADGQVEYIGEAESGSEDNKPVWRIHKRTYANNRLTKIAWSNYNAKFNKIWSSRTSYNYR